MMKLIKLTQRSQATAYVNPESVTSLLPYVHGGTTLYLMDQGQLNVLEDIEEVKKLLCGK